jgi:inhibitor of cysteine peptidase
MQKKQVFIPLTILILTLFLAACASQPVENPSAAEPDPEQPVSSNDPTPSEEIPDAQSVEGEEDMDLIIGESAYVDSIDILFLESFPLQVHAVLKGNLPDGCTKIREITVEKDGEEHFIIHIITQKPQGLMCTQALVPFEENIALDVYGLPAGTYTITAGEIETSFTFEQDNSLE